jgi:cobalt/nickel transport system permease protein
MWPSILALHIPDGFLSVPVSAVGWLLFVIVLAYALRQTRTQLGEKQIPLIGILAAFVFAAQMINFPVAGGTSGHLLGATLVAILVGPWAMILVMTSVIGVQALIFQDGGLLALGFNIINMGVLSGLVGYAIYTGIVSLMRKSPTSMLIGAGVGAWCGVVVAAAATALQLAISGTSALNIALPAMLTVHVLIGIGEALITVAALAFVNQTRPDLIDQTTQSERQGSRWIAVGFVIALVVAFLSPLADSNPDGLERVAEDQGFLSQAQDPAYTLLPDYTVPFIESEVFTTIAAGVIGVLIVSGISFAVARLSARKRNDELQQPHQTVSS